MVAEVLMIMVMVATAAEKLEDKDMLAHIQVQVVLKLLVEKIVHRLQLPVLLAKEEPVTLLIIWVVEAAAGMVEPVAILALEVAVLVMFIPVLQLQIIHLVVY